MSHSTANTEEMESSRLRTRMISYAVKSWRTKAATATSREDVSPVETTRNSAATRLANSQGPSRKLTGWPKDPNFLSVKRA